MFDPTTWRAVLKSALALLPSAVSVLLSLFRPKPKERPITERGFVVVYLVVVRR